MDRQWLAVYIALILTAALVAFGITLTIIYAY